MSENKKVTSSIPLKALYGIGEDGSLFIIEPENEFNIFRLVDSVGSDVEEVENSIVKGIENLEISDLTPVSTDQVEKDFNYFS